MCRIPGPGVTGPLPVVGEIAMLHQLSQPAKIREQNPDHDQDKHDYGGERYGTAGSSKTCSSGHGLMVGSPGMGNKITVGLRRWRSLRGLECNRGFFTNWGGRAGCQQRLSMEDYSSSQSLREQSFGRGPSQFCLNSCSYFSMNAHLARRIQSSATS